MLRLIGRITRRIETDDKVVTPVERGVRNAGGKEDGVTRAQEPNQSRALPSPNPDLRRSQRDAVDDRSEGEWPVDWANPQRVRKSKLERE